MATITLKINEKSKAGKTFLDLIQLFNSKKAGIEIIEKDYIPNKETLKAMKEAKEGKVISAKNVDELMEKLLA